MRVLDYSIKEKIFDDYNNKKSHIITTNSGKRKKRHSVSALAQHYNVSVSTCYSIIHEFENEGKEVSWRKQYSTLDDKLEYSCAIEKDENVLYDNDTETDIPKMEDSSKIDTIIIGKEEVHEEIKKKYPLHESSIDYSPIAETKVEEIVTEMDETTNLIRKNDYVLGKYKEQFKIKGEKEKYNNQSIVLYKAIDFIDSEHINYITDKLDITQETLYNAMKTYNKDNYDFTLENRIADCLIEKGMITINDNTENHVDEKRSNQASVLNACKRILEKSKDNNSLMGYIKGAIRTELNTTSNADVEDAYKEIFSSQYKVDDDFKIANRIIKELSTKAPYLFQGTNGIALLHHKYRDRDSNVFEKVKKLQHSTTEIIDEENLPAPEKVVLKQSKKRAIESQTNMPVIAKSKTIKSSNFENPKPSTGISVKKFKEIKNDKENLPAPEKVVLKQSKKIAIESQTNMPVIAKSKTIKSSNFENPKPPTGISVKKFKEVKNFINTDSDIVTSENKERTDKFRKLLDPKAKSNLIEKLNEKNKKRRANIKIKPFNVASVVSLGATYISSLFF